MRGRRAGFGLGEALLLVVIAGGLMGLSRGAHRPSAEQTCLANVKTICAAIQMYASDNDGRLPPREMAESAVSFFEAQRGLEGRQEQFLNSGDYDCFIVREGGPYSKWPVVLDEYVPGRNVWSCPSARVAQSASFIVGPADWLSHLKAHAEGWGRGGERLCLRRVFPSGWGGAVTDSLTQAKLAAEGFVAGSTALSGERWTDPEAPPGVFTQSIGTNGNLAGVRLDECPDLDRVVVAADAGADVEEMMTGTLAYPDICALECANPQCGWADWEGCTSAADCGLYRHARNDGSFIRDPEVRKPYARHRGGVNIGFADGHARWFDSEEVLRRSLHPRADALLGYEWAMPGMCSCEEDRSVTLSEWVAVSEGHEVPKADADEDDEGEPGDHAAACARRMPGGM